ncbi:MAG: hypothetical protein WAN36_13455, partial [Calditrichia bacterium]
ARDLEIRLGHDSLSLLWPSYNKWLSGRAADNNAWRQQDKKERSLKWVVTAAALALVLMLSALYFLKSPELIETGTTALQQTETIADSIKPDVDTAGAADTASFFAEQSRSQVYDSLLTSLPPGAIENLPEYLPLPLLAAQNQGSVSVQPQTGEAEMKETLPDQPENKPVNYAERFIEFARQALQQRDFLRAAHFFALSAYHSENQNQIEQCRGNIRQLLAPAWLTGLAAPGRGLSGLTFSHQVNQMAVWGSGHSIQIVSVPEMNRQIQPLSVPGEIWGCEFSTDDRYLLSWGSDGQARLWRVSDGILLTAVSHGANVNGAFFNPGGGMVISWGADSTAKVWNPANGKLFFRPLQHPSAVREAILSPDGRIILTRTYAGEAYLWNAATGDLISGQSLQPRPLVRRVEGAAFINGGQQAITWSSRAVDFWRSFDAKLMKSSITLDYGLLKGVAVDPDSRFLLTWDGFRFLRMWRLPGRSEGREPLPFPENIVQVSFSSSGERQLVQCADGRVFLLNTKDGSLAGPPVQHQGKIAGVTFLDSSKWLCSWDEGGTMRLWSAADASAGAVPMLHAGPVRKVSWQPAFQLLAGWSSESGDIRLWNLTGNDAPEMQALMNMPAGENSAKRLPLLTEVLTGTVINPGGQLAVLTPQGWIQRRNELYQYLKSTATIASPGPKTSALVK